MRKLSANYICPISSPPLKNGILYVDDDDSVIKIVENPDNREFSHVEFYNGVIVPGFINAHCHLELSHFKSRINHHTGLAAFISQLMKIRENISKELVEEQLNKYDSLMQKKGIVAVGDIVNTDITIKTKLQSKLYYHSFVEIYGSNPMIANKSYQEGIQLLDQFEKHALAGSLSPHAPYSISPDLFRLISDHLANQTGAITMHNQESEDENEMFITKTGSIANMINKSGTDLNVFPDHLESSLLYSSGFFKKNQNIILVHNTFTKEYDINLLKPFKNLTLCLCPGANLFIENRLPDIEMLSKQSFNICIGTDSLASNDKLDVLAEMKIISDNFPDISFHEIIKWGTINGAKALLIDNKFGSFESGKKPGVVLIENLDLQTFKFTDKTTSKSLL